MKILQITTKLVHKSLSYLLWKYNKWILFSFIQRPDFASIYNKITVKDKRTTLEANEIFNIYSSVIATAKVRGDIAEVGVYRGGSAKIICLMSDKIGINKKIHLFDTFEGLPEVMDIDTKWKKKRKFKKGEFAASLQSVQNYLKAHKNVQYHKGFFPSTAEPVRKTKFSFVHLDVDIYQSTKDCLEFFYPRMNKGGVIISHDYPFANGVKKAFDEFFRNKAEIVISLMNKQAMVVKL